MPYTFFRSGDKQAILADTMSLAVFALQRVFVIHVSALPSLGMSLLPVLVVLEPSGNSVLVLGVEEFADLHDVTDHCGLRIRISACRTPNLHICTHMRQLWIWKSPCGRRLATTSSLQRGEPCC